MPSTSLFSSPTATLFACLHATNEICSAVLHLSAISFSWQSPTKTKACEYSPHLGQLPGLTVLIHAQLVMANSLFRHSPTLVQAHLSLVRLRHVTAADVERDGGLCGSMQLRYALRVNPTPDPLPVPPRLHMPAHACMPAS